MRDTQDKAGDALKETAGNAEDKPADKVEKTGKEQTEAAAGILMEEQMQQNAWEMILPGRSFPEIPAAGKKKCLFPVLC